MNKISFVFHVFPKANNLYFYNGLRARSYFRFAAALSVAPPLLPVNLTAWEGYYLQFLENLGIARF